VWLWWEPKSECYPFSVFPNVELSNCRLICKCGNINFNDLRMKPKHLVFSIVIWYTTLCANNCLLYILDFIVYHIIHTVETCNVPVLFGSLCTWRFCGSFCYCRYQLFRLCVCHRNSKSLWTQYLTNRLWKFHLICSLGAIEDEDELFRFWGQ